VTGWEVLPGESPVDPSGLRLKGITSRRQLNDYEAENVRKATVKYLARRPTWSMARFDLPWARKLHKEMFGDVWKWAGNFRTCNLNIGVPWEHVEASLETLLGNLALWAQGEMGLIEQAGMLHHKAVSIHPFQNGNGRWSRLLANIWLKIHRASPTAWPEQTIGSKSAIRDEYLAAIRSADRGEYEALIELHRRFTPEI
jgi:Fic-DOC domain mobile mystery protein B